MKRIEPAIKNTVVPVRKKETFYRTCGVCVNAGETGEKPVYDMYRVKSEGYPFEVNGFTIYVDKDTGGEWRATEAKTGAVVIFGKTKKELVMLLEHVNTGCFKQTMLDEAEEKKEKYPIVTQKEYDKIREEARKA